MEIEKIPTNFVYNIKLEEDDAKELAQELSQCLEKTESNRSQPLKHFYDKLAEFSKLLESRISEDS